MNAQSSKTPGKGGPGRGLLTAACVGLVSVILLAPSAHAEAKAKATNDLVNLINQYRQQKNLPPIALSEKLTTVAKVHAEDLANNSPHTKLCPSGKSNMHSWTPNGTKWKGGCYDGENQSTWNIMWDKPKEITGYPTEGYEICESGASTAQEALDDWKASDLHRPVILNEGVWKNYPWKAIGAAECQGYWCVWFGQTLDTSKPPGPTVFLKDYDKPKKAVWVTDLITIDPSKVKKIGGGSESGDDAKPDEATAPKGEPSGSKVRAGIHGRVYAMDPSGVLLGTVSGAAIELKGQSGEAASQITSGENGYYRADLPPGRYFYKVTAPGYKDEDKGRGFDLQKTDEGCIYNFWLVKGENDPDRKPPQIPTSPIATLKGTVWERTEDGELVGIPQAVVSLRRDDSTDLARVTTSSAESQDRPVGAYEIVLAAGSWRASAGAAGFETLVDPEPIAIVEGQEAKRDFVLKRRKASPPTEQGIKGIVRVEGTRIGDLPEDLKIEVFPVPGGDVLGSPQVDSAGGFRQEANPGAYRVQAAASGYLAAQSGIKYVLPERYTFVNLVLRKEMPDFPELPETPEVPETPATPEIPETPEVAPVPRESRVLVKVMGAERGHQLPLPDARVLLRHAEEDLASAQRQTTNAVGEVDFPIKRPGHHVALAQCKGYQPGGVELDVAAGTDATTTIVLTKRPEVEDTPPTGPPPVQPEEAEPVEVSGYVVYKDARSKTGLYGVEGARLSWRRLDSRRPGTPRVVTTQGVGDFRLQLNEGEYQVSFALPGEYLPKEPEHLVVRVGMDQKWFFVRTRPAERPTEPEVQPEPDIEQQPEIEPQPDVPGGVVHVRGHVVTRSPRVPGGLAAVGGATVQWHPQRGEGLRPGAARSDSRGRFSLNLRQGFYIAEVAPPPGYRRTERQVHVQPGMASTTLIVERIEQEGEGAPEGPTEPPPPEEQQPPPGGKAGLVLQVFGREGGRTFPLGACQVRIAHGRRIVAQGQTDRVGSFQTQLANGSYEAVATKEGFSMGRTGVVINGQNVSRRIFLDRQPSGTPGIPGGPPAEQMVSLHVRVMVTFPKPPKQGQPGGFATAPAGGAGVTILQGGRAVASGTADQGGNYTTRLAPGAYQINVSHGNLRQTQGVTLRQGNESRTITLQSGAALMPEPEGPARPIEPRPPQRPTGPIQVRPLEGPLRIIPAVPQPLRRAR